MKWSITAISLILLSPGALAVEKDKFMHLGLSTAIASGVTVVSEDWRVGFGSCMAVGLAKELIDERNYGGFDAKDLAADFIGCSLGTVIGDYGLKAHYGDEYVGISYSWRF